MYKTIRPLALAAATLIGLVWVVQLTISNTVNYVVAVDAERKARDWAGYFVTHMEALPELIVSGRPNSQQQNQISAAAEIGDVFRFKLFDGTGSLVLISDELAKNLEAGASGDHSGKAALVLSSGIANVSLNDGTQKANRPDLYVEAYVPVFGSSNSIVGVVEVYLDQTPVASLLSNSFNFVALVLGGVLIIAFGVPYLGFMFKTVQENKARSRADYLAKFDLTTGLMNRASFTKCIKKRLTHGDFVLKDLAVTFIDIDKFKTINDSFGHKAGDAFLKHIGKTILAEVDPDALVGRMGGDEIVIVSPKSSVARAKAIAEKIRLEATKPLRMDGTTISGSISAGIHFDNYAKDLSFEDRMQKADISLYQSKLDGRNTCTIYTSALEATIEARRVIEAALTNALEENRLNVHYQPLLRRSDEKVAGFEALLRLTDRDGKNIPPLEFIPVAEEMGLIKPIGAWVIEQAAFASNDWPKGVFVSVNLSSRQFEDETLVEEVQDILMRSGADPSRLELEITESLLMENTESVSAQLAELGDMGISLAMDDFGTGYSSLAYLWQFGFNKIKIDKSFIDGLEADEDKVREILDTIIMLGHRLDMTVTAEGIETSAQAETLANLECDHFQGYLYGRPMPHADLASFVMGNFVEHIEAPKTEKLTDQKVS